MKLSEFKVGDRVKGFVGYDGTDPFESTVKAIYDDSLVLDKLDGDYDDWSCSLNLDGDVLDAETGSDLLQLISHNTTTMNLKEKFTTIFKKEPEKSFRKARITDGDDFLTENGKQIFLSWLLKKNGVEFKKEVVDEILKDKEEEENKK